MYIHESIDYKVRNDLQIDANECESNFIEITNVKLPPSPNTPKQKPLYPIVGVIYRHPRENIDEFLDCFYAKIEPLASKNQSLAILGDININDDPSKDSQNISNYRLLLQSIGCSNLINQPTRPASHTVLDHIITNVSSEKTKAGIVRHYISDHLPIFLNINISKTVKKKKNRIRKKRFFPISKKEPFVKDLSRSIEKNFTSQINDPEIRMEKTISTIQNVMETHFPMQNVSQKQSVGLEKP